MEIIWDFDVAIISEFPVFTPQVGSGPPAPVEV